MDCMPNRRKTYPFLNKNGYMWTGSKLNAKIPVDAVIFIQWFANMVDSAL